MKSKKIGLFVIGVVLPVWLVIFYSGALSPGIATIVYVIILVPLYLFYKKIVRQEREIQLWR